MKSRKILFCLLLFVVYLNKKNFSQTNDTLRTNFPANEILKPYSYKIQNISILSPDSKDYFVHKSDLYGPLGLIDLDKSNFDIIERIAYPDFLFVRYTIKNNETIKLRKYARKDYLGNLSGFKAMTYGDKSNPFHMTYYCYTQIGNEFYFTEGDKDKGIAFLNELLTKKYETKACKYLPSLHDIQQFQLHSNIAEAFTFAQKLQYTSYSWGDESTGTYVKTDFNFNTNVLKTKGKIKVQNSFVDFSINSYANTNNAELLFKTAFDKEQKDINAKRLTDISISKEENFIRYNTSEKTSIIFLLNNKIITFSLPNDQNILIDELKTLTQKLNLKSDNLIDIPVKSDVSGIFSGISEFL